MASFPPSSRGSANSRGPSWPHVSDYSQVMLSPASTLPVSTPVHLTHTIVSAENPFKHHNTSLRHARYTSKHRDNSSCQSQTISHSQSSSERRKAARPWETFWQHLRLASDHGSERPHQRRMMRMRITDKFRGRRAQSHFTNNTPIHNTYIKLHHHSYQLGVAHT
jgi:hypothetical protein